MKFLNQLFLKGLVVFLPVSLTIYLLGVILSTAESVFSKIIIDLLGENLYIPGFGIVLTVISILILGLLVSNYITARIVNWFTKTFEKVPLIKAIYNPLKELFSMFGSGQSQQGQKVVLFYLESMGVEVIGLVMREDFSDISNEISDEKVIVYIPMSYMLGGFSCLVEKSKLKILDIPVEKALKLAITGYIRNTND